MKEAVLKLKLLGAEVVQVDLGFRADDFDLYALGLFSTSLGYLVFVPIGMTKEGIPLGMQIIGDTYDDLAAFQVA